MDNRKKLLIIISVVCTMLFGQDVALAIVQPIVTVLGSMMPAV